MTDQPNPTKRKARAMVRRAVVEVLARTDAPDDGVTPTGDITLLLHHIPDSWLPKMVAVVQMMLDWAEPVPYSEIVDGPADGARFSVTFDDGNQSQMKAAQRLAELGVPACFFVIADALDADEAETARICREQLWMDSTPFMTRDDLDRLLELGHEVGSHTRGHLNLADLTGDQLADQVGGSRDALAQWLGHAPHFAWPFGGSAHFSMEAYEAVADAGYASCASAMRGAGIWRSSAAGSEGPPLVFRQSIDLRDSLPVQRRFVVNSNDHTAGSKEALAFLNPVFS